MQFYLLNPFISRVIGVLALDLAAYSLAALGTWFYLKPPMSVEAYLASIGIGGVLAFLSLYYCDVYRPAVLCSLRRSIPSLIGATGIAFALATFTGFAVSTTARTIPLISHVAGFAFCFILLGRASFRLLSSNPRLNRNVLLIGASEVSGAIADSVRKHPNLGFEIVGFLSDEADFSFSGATFAGYPILGPVHNVEKAVDKFAVDKIVVASRSRTEFFPAEALLRWKVQGLSVESGVSFLERITGKIDLAGLRPSYLIFSDGFAVRRLDEALIRLLDVSVAALALLLASPALLVCAAAIRMESPGPIFYRQTRVG
ncbi:sugar transferase, partial [Myxococcota bacterium]|nr:sugar transferase [Myxococcota bacterium]